MPHKHDRLFDDIASFPALVKAARNAIKGKRRKPGAAAFMANLEKEVVRLERELLDGSYRPGRYKVIHVRDPKPRMVSAAPFRDRVVHHALCAVVEPIFERGFIFDSYANRTGKGAHRAVDRYEAYADRFDHVLRCDIYRFFPAIDHDILKREFRRRVACVATLTLLDRIVDASNDQEPVLQHFPGDDLLSPISRRRGLPIGNLTSQFFANLYLNGLDHFCREILGARGYLRYVDDFVLFHDEREILYDWRERIAGYLQGRRLRLHPRKTLIIDTGEPTSFLGYDLVDGLRRLPEANVSRFRARLRSMTDRCLAGSLELREAQRCVDAWVGHASNADTWRLRQSIFRDGPLAPKRKPVRLPVASVSCAAVPGTTIR
ncbi:MAG: RNA-directed DNA polymerase [Rhodospirillales bacterium]